MRALKIIITFISIFVLVSFGGAIAELSIEGTFSSSLVFSGTIIASFTFLHYRFHCYLNPIYKLSGEKRKLISLVMSKYYSSNFFAGSIGLGYVFLLMTLVPLFDSKVHIDNNGFFLLSIFLVIFGTISKTRGLIFFLLDECKFE